MCVGRDGLTGDGSGLWGNSEDGRQCWGLGAQRRAAVAKDMAEGGCGACAAVPQPGLLDRSSNAASRRFPQANAEAVFRRPRHATIHCPAFSLRPACHVHLTLPCPSAPHLLAAGPAVAAHDAALAAAAPAASNGGVGVPRRHARQDHGAGQRSTPNGNLNKGAIKVTHGAHACMCVVHKHACRSAAHPLATGRACIRHSTLTLQHQLGLWPAACPCKPFGAGAHPPTDPPTCSRGRPRRR